MRDMCFGIGFMIAMAAASGMDAPDITANVIALAIGLGMCMIGIKGQSQE